MNTPASMVDTERPDRQAADRAVRAQSAGRVQERLRILTYHRIADITESPHLDPRLISTTPALFERQMEYVATHYRVVGIDDVIAAVERGVPLGPRATLISFDDAYRDLATHAFPALYKRRLKAVIFVPTSYPDRPERAFWWDRVYRAVMDTSRPHLRVAGLGRLPLGSRQERIQSSRTLQNHVLTRPHVEGMSLVEQVCDELGARPVVMHSVLRWQELREAMAHGIAVAPHTRTHPALTRLPLPEAQAEIAGSQADIERETGSTLPAFCYPNGDHNSAIVVLLRQMNFRVAVTTSNGQNTLALADPLRLKRQAVYKRSTMPVFRVRMSRVGGYLERWRS